MPRIYIFLAYLCYCRLKKASRAVATLETVPHISGFNYYINPWWNDAKSCPYPIAVTATLALYLGCHTDVHFYEWEKTKPSNILFYQIKHFSIIFLYIEKCKVFLGIWFTTNLSEIAKRCSIPFKVVLKPICLFYDLTKI